MGQGEVKKRAQGHTSSKWLSQWTDSSNRTPVSELLPTTPYIEKSPQERPCPSLPTCVRIWPQPSLICQFFSIPISVFLNGFPTYFRTLVPFRTESSMFSIEKEEFYFLCCEMFLKYSRIFIQMTFINCLTIKTCMSRDLLESTELQKAFDFSPLQFPFVNGMVWW